MPKLKKDGARERAEELLELETLNEATRSSKKRQQYWAFVTIEGRSMDVAEAETRIESFVTEGHPSRRPVGITARVMGGGQRWIAVEWTYTAKGANYNDVRRQVEKALSGMDVVIKIDGERVVELDHG